MADVLVKSKEAIVIVLDVGRSMHYDGKQVTTTLSKAKTCIDMILQRKIFSESKDEIALVLFGTSETANKFASPDTMEYNHIVIAQELRPASWDLLQFVQDIEGSDTSADLIKCNALLVAMDLLQNTMNGKKFFSRRILFLSQFDETFCDDKVGTICESLKCAQIDLNLIGPLTLDEEELDDSLKLYRPKTVEQLKAEAAIRQLLNAANGESYSFEEALPALIYYQKKKVQSLPWNANLDIGKNLTIPISAYIKVYENKSKPWKNAFAHKLNAKIEKETTYHLNDEAQTEVSKDNIIPAYRYGTTLVPFSEEDKVNMEYQSGEKGMKVLGFTKEENVCRYYYIGDKTMYIFGQKNRELAGVILAPFIQALYETKMVAIVRYVYSARSAPKIGFLSPRIKPNYECLVFIVLPFMEDLRNFVFAPLDSHPKNLPTEEQLCAVDDLITAMDLSIAASDEDGNQGEALKAKNTVNPHLQRLYQCLQHRVFNADTPLPDIPSHIRAVIDPAPKLLKNANRVLKEMQRIFPLSDGAKKRSFENRRNLFSNGKHHIDADQGIEKPSSKDAIGSESIVQAAEDEITEIGTINPVEDFRYLTSHSNETGWFEEICRQLGKAVMRLLSDAVINMQEDKIISCLTEFRTASIKREQPSLFNDFMKSLKGTLILRSHMLWKRIIDEKLGLIISAECFPSTISFQEASEFSSNLPDESSGRMDEDEKDLLEEL